MKMELKHFRHTYQYGGVNLEELATFALLVDHDELCKVSTEYLKALDNFEKFLNEKEIHYEK